MSTKNSCEHHHHYWALISLLALALVCCFIIIWFLPNNFNTGTTITKILKPKAVPVENLWQKFSNDQHNYSLTIPASWPIKVNDANQVTFGTVPFETGSGWLTLSITPGLTVSDWVQENYSSETENASTTLQTAADFQSPTGLGAKVYTKNQSSSSLENFVVFDHDKKLYILNYLTNDEKFNNEVLQIINSLAFTD